MNEWMDRCLGGWRGRIKETEADGKQTLHILEIYLEHFLASIDSKYAGLYRWRRY